MSPALPSANRWTAAAGVLLATALSSVAGQADEHDPADQAAADDAELAATLSAIESETTQELRGGRPLRIYGFLDVGFHKMMVPETSFLYPLLATNSSTFVLGNINLYFDAQPSEDWRGLVEVRLTNEPHGQDIAYASALGGEYERVDSTTYDTTSPNGRNRMVLGNIVLERAWIEWTGSDLFKLRTGYWFTPFGIWNVDHGSPTLISLLLPDTQVAQYAPLRQLGVQALGSAFTGSWELGYNAYVSNGRTPGQQDLTEDKAVGGRVFATHVSNGTTTSVGLSGYYGTYADVEKRIVSFDPFRVEVDQTVDATEWAAGADLSLDHDGLRLRTEGAVKRISYETGKQDVPDFGRPDALLPDSYRWDWYALAAYRLPWGGLEPYLWFEVIHRPSSLGDTVLVPSVGMNVHFTPEAQLKLQYAQVRFIDAVTDSSRDPSDNDFAAFLSRLVLAF